MGHHCDHHYKYYPPPPPMRPRGVLARAAPAEYWNIFTYIYIYIYIYNIYMYI